MLVQGKTYSPNYKVRKRIQKEEKDWVRCENCHEAIVSAEDYRLVRQSYELDTRVSPNEQILHLFSGIAKCGHCKGNMTRKTVRANGKAYVYLVCVENKNSKKCSFHKMISWEKFKNAILQIINVHIENIFEVNRMLDIAQDVPYCGYLSEKLQDNILDKELAVETKRRYSSEVYEDFKEGIITKGEYLELKDLFRLQIRTLEKEIQSLKEELEEHAKDRADKVLWVEQFIQYRGFQQLTREILLKLVDEIRVFDKDRIEVVFKYQQEYEEAYKRIRNVGGKETAEGKEEADGTKE